MYFPKRSKSLTDKSLIISLETTEYERDKRIEQLKPKEIQIKKQVRVKSRLFRIKSGHFNK